MSLILLHGLFVAGEFGLVAADRSRIEQLADRGHRAAISTLKALKTLSFQLSGAQLGITVTSLIVGFIIEPTVGEALEPVISELGFIPEESVLAVSVGIALALATATEMVVAELVPKNLAIAKPVGVAFAVSSPLRWCNALFRPLIVFLNASANWTVRRLGIEPREELIPMRSLQELDLLIRSARETGALPEEDFSLLVRSISFGDKTAADALIPRTSIIALGKDETLSDLARTALETGHSRFPVYGRDLDDIVGVAHVKDSYRVAPEERARTSLSEIMQDALVVPESRDLESLLLEMRRERKQLAVVIDEYGGTAGIITLEDLLEEIVGEIEDEYDPSGGAVPPTMTPEGVHILPGLTHLEEVADATGCEIPEGDYETLAGFLLSLFDRIPAAGDHVSFKGWEFKVTAMERNRIAQVLMVRTGDVTGGDEAES